MAEEQKVGRSEKFMRALENFDKAKELFGEAKKIYAEAIDEDPANEEKIKEVAKDLFEKIRSAMAANLQEMGELLGLPKESVLSKRQ